MDDFYNVSPFLIPITAIVGSFVYIIIKTLLKARVRELEIRERIAMIERGLVPPPEVDPRGFDRAMSRLERRNYHYGSGRHRRAGVTLMGVGFGLMLMIGVAGDNPEAGIGVGGFLVVIGLAFVVNGMIGARYESPFPPTGGGVPPAPPSEPTHPS